MKQREAPLGYRRYAKMVADSKGNKSYEPLCRYDKKIEQRIKEEFGEIIGSFPIVPIMSGYNTNQILKHNYRAWHQLFSDRQIVCIKHMIDGIETIGDPDLKLLSSCLFSGVLEFNNLFTSFKGEGTGAVRHMFSHHILKPETMPLEANIWGTSQSSGSFSTLFKSRVERALCYKADPFELQVNSSKSRKVHRINRPIAAQVTGDFETFAANKTNKMQAFLSTGDSGCTDLPDGSHRCSGFF